MSAMSTYKPREDILVLDGIPRNVVQTELVKDHLDIRKVVNLQCSDEEDMIHRFDGEPFAKTGPMTQTKT